MSRKDLLRFFDDFVKVGSGHLIIRFFGLQLPSILLILLHRSGSIASNFVSAVSSLCSGPIKHLVKDGKGALGLLKGTLYELLQPAF